MEKFHKKLVLSSLLIGLPMVFGSAVYAAQPVNLGKQKASILQSFISAPGVAAGNGIKVKEISHSLDFKKTLHVRIQQMYAGHEVWGADAVVHIPQGEKLAQGKSFNSIMSAAAQRHTTMNGTIYQGLTADLGAAPAGLASGEQSAINSVISNWHSKVGVKAPVKDQQARLIVFMDAQSKAHWAYQVSFSADVIKDGGLPAKPNYIVDATSHAVYAEWDDIKTSSVTDGEAFGGGFGGNEKMGKVSYDGLKLDGHNSKLKIIRNNEDKTCTLKNSEVTVKNSKTGDVMSYTCKDTDVDHNEVFWNGEEDAVNGGYGPMNDALFGGAVIKNMYFNWYGVPVLTKNGEPMMLTMVVHARMDNAYWDGSKMTFGDGINMFYPLTSLGIAAHEISHGFTQQHSNLAYYSQSGGMNEAYSDMAAQAAEYYAYNGKNSWQIGPEIFKNGDRALRYMDQPSKDCNGKKPGSWCSIDDAGQYYSGLDVHYSSGVFNRAFYLMGSAAGWDAKKAFDVMVLANENYWTKTSTFEQGACGVLQATIDKGYELDVVKKAFETVKVDTSACTLTPKADPDVDADLAKLAK